MCIGLPMRIVETDGFTATCAWKMERRRVSLLLTGELPVGAHVLVHVDNAVRELDPNEAEQIGAALEGLAAALRGDDFEHFFADIGAPDQTDA